MLRLLKKYLEWADRPFLKSLVFTLFSFFLCILPVLFLIASEIIVCGIRWILELLPHLDWGWWGWLSRAIAWMLVWVDWLIENITLLAMPALIVVFGTGWLACFMQRASIRLMIATYIFKRATEPLLVLHFAAFSVKWLISFEAFYALDKLLNTFGVQFTIGSGQMVSVTLVMWFLLTLGLNLQLKIIREEKIRAGESDVMETIRHLLLGWIDKSLQAKKNRS